MSWCNFLTELSLFFFFFQAEDGIRDGHVTGVQTCALPISDSWPSNLGSPCGTARSRIRDGWRSSATRGERSSSRRRDVAGFRRGGLLTRTRSRLSSWPGRTPRWSWKTLATESDRSRKDHPSRATTARRSLRGERWLLSSEVGTTRFLCVRQPASKSLSQTCPRKDAERATLVVSRGLHRGVHHMLIRDPSARLTYATMR